ncbi:hypothetical protein BHE74_00010687, partial [Ensete ventricosum]
KSPIRLERPHIKVATKAFTHADLGLGAWSTSCAYVLNPVVWIHWTWWRTHMVEDSEELMNRVDKLGVWPSTMRKKVTDVDKVRGRDARLFLRAPSMVSQRLRTPAETAERREIGMQRSRFFLSSLIYPPAEVGGYSDEVFEGTKVAETKVVRPMTVASHKRTRRAMALRDAMIPPIYTLKKKMMLERSPNGLLRHRASRSVLDEKIIAETSSRRERESSDDLTTKTSPEDTEVASETAAEVPRPMVRPRRHPLELQHKSERGRETRGRWMTWTGERWLIQEAERSMSSMVAQKSTLPRLGRPRSRGRPPSSAFPAPRVEAEANRCSPDPIFPEQKYGNAKHDQSRAVSCCQVAADHNYCFLGSVISLSSSPSSLYAYLNFR